MHTHTSIYGQGSHFPLEGGGGGSLLLLILEVVIGLLDVVISWLSQPPPVNFGRKQCSSQIWANFDKNRYTLQRLVNRKTEWD